MDISSKDRLLQVLSAVDKANGFCFSGSGSSMRSLSASAVGGSQFEYARTGEIREKYLDREANEARQDGAGEQGRRGSRERLGNDLDKVDINPGFQV